MFKFINKIFKKSSKQDNWKKSIFYALEAETERRNRNYKNALKSISKAINLSPKNDMYYVTRALIHKDLKNYKQALNDINKSLELNNGITHTQKIKDELINLTD